MPLSGPLPAGTAAPGFELNSTPDQKVDLRHFRGRPVVLAFYPADWSPVCGDQLALYNEILPEFNRYAAQILGISVDGVWCHVAYASRGSCIFHCSPISSRKAAVAREYGVYRQDEGVCAAPCSSSTVMALSAGLMFHRWASIRAEGILNSLEALHAKETQHATHI